MIFGNITSLADLKRDTWIHKHIWELSPSNLWNQGKITQDGR